MTEHVDPGVLKMFILVLKSQVDRFGQSSLSNDGLLISLPDMEAVDDALTLHTYPFRTGL